MNHDDPRSPVKSTTEGTVQYQPKPEDMAGSPTETTADGTVAYKPLAETVSPETVGFELAAGIKAVETPHKMPEVPGYHLEKELGRGGMGVVYLARQLRLNRPVALKMILNAAHTDAQMKLRFIAEAEAIAKLHHSGIVQVYEFGTHDENPYFALEFLSGGSLDKALAGTPLPAMEAARLVAKLANAVQSAHEHGIVHRDLKPANILLNNEGNLLSAQKSKDRSNTESCTLGTLQPKITDFGLVKQEGSDMTATGAILGTPSYMAPEQADGKKTVGPATDIYALGAILYECLTGRPPFKAAKMMETIFQVIHHDPVAPRQLVAALPIDLETITLKCLQKSPEKRYATAADLETDLNHFIHGEPINARPVGVLERGWRWCNRNRKLAGAIATAVFIAILASVLGVKTVLDAKQRDVDTKQRQLDATNIESLEKIARVEKFSKELFNAGQREAMRPRGWTWDNIDTLKKAIQDKPEGADIIALRSSLVNAATTPDIRRVMTLLSGFSSDEMAFSPDGKWLAMGIYKGSWISVEVRLFETKTWKEVARLTTSPSMVTRPGKPPAQDGIRSITFTPDSKWLIAGARSGNLHRWDLSASPPAYTTWPGHKGEADRIAISPDGKRAYTTGEDRLLKAWDVTQGWRPNGQFEGLDNSYNLAVSPDNLGVICCTKVNNKPMLTWLDAQTLKPTGRMGQVPFSGTTLCMMPNGDTLGMESEGKIHLAGLSAPSPRLFRFESKWARLPLARVDGGDDLLVTPDGGLLINADSYGKIIQFWDTRSGMMVNEFPVTGGTQKLALSPEGKYLSVAEENHVSLYEIAKRDLSAVAAVRPWPISGIALSPDGSELTCRCHLSMHAESADHELTQWMVQKGQVQPKPKSSMFVIRCFTLDQLCYRQEGGIFFQIGNTLHSLFKGISKPEHTMNDASAISVAPDGKLWVCHDINLSVFTGSSGKLAFPVWNYPMGHLINGRGGLAALATGRLWTLVSASDGSLHVFSATTGNHEPTKMLILKPPFPEVGKSLFLTADETSAFVGDNNGNITVVKIPSLEIERTHKAHSAPVNALVRHQNAFFVSGSNDNSIRLWDFHGHELVTIRVHAPVRELALSPDGRTLYAVIGNDRAVTVWHLDRINELLKSQGIEIEVIP